MGVISNYISSLELSKSVRNAVFLIIKVIRLFGGHGQRDVYYGNIDVESTYANVHWPNSLIIRSK